MSTFNYTPDYAAQKTVEPAVQKIQFGDGYEHRQATGLNYQFQKWALKFENRTSVEADAIDAFLLARGAVESFDWTPPDAGAALKFVCRGWTKSMDHAGISTVTATFEQIYEP